MFVMLGFVGMRPICETLVSVFLPLNLLVMNK